MKTTRHAVMATVGAVVAALAVSTPTAAADIAPAATAVATATSAAATTTRSAPQRLGVQTKLVQLSDVTAATPYVSFTVPACVSEIAYVMDGAAGGGSRPKDVSNRSEGGRGALISGVLSVSPGEVLHLYPSARGEGALEDSKSGDTAYGGAIGYSHGGNGVGHDDGWIVRQNPSGGGGASSAITTATAPLAVAGGGGGGGGSAWSWDPNPGVGGNGDAPGADGENNPGTGGVVGGSASANGAVASTPQNRGGGGGGGGGGYVGGGAGVSGTQDQKGGGGGAGGTSFRDSARSLSTSIAEFGLTTDGFSTAGDGAVKIAWPGCSSTLRLDGTTTSAAGVTSAAAGWSHMFGSTAGISVSPASMVLGSDGVADTVVSGYTSPDSVMVYVMQEQRNGWLLRDWSESALDQPRALCLIEDDSARPARVLNDPDRHVAFAVFVPAGTWVHCRFDTVEAAPALATSPSWSVPSGEQNPTSVSSGTAVTFDTRVENTGNVPLTLGATDPKNPSLSCQLPELLPGATTHCVGTTAVTRD